jgi:hypothetical protein
LLDGVKPPPDAAVCYHFQKKSRLSPEQDQRHRKQVFLRCAQEVLDPGWKLFALQVTEALNAHNCAHAKHEHNAIERPLAKISPKAE